MQHSRFNRNNATNWNQFESGQWINPRNSSDVQQPSHRSIHLPRGTTSSSAAALNILASGKRSAGGQNDNEFRRESLQVHNELRRRHGVQPLRLNDDLTKLAQNWGKSTQTESIRNVRFE